MTKPQGEYTREDLGVREYWLVDPDNQKVIVYLLGDDINTFLYTFDDKIPVAI